MSRSQIQKRVSVKQRVRDTVSGHISLSAYEQVATSRFMCKDHQKQPDVTRKGLLVDVLEGRSIKRDSKLRINFKLGLSADLHLVRSRTIL